MKLIDLIAAEEPQLRAISEQVANTRPGGGPGWTRKQELGHLIDSAANNRQRFIVASLQGSLDLPSYDGSGWVRLGGYDAMSWNTLIDLWKALNQAILPLLDRIPPERLSAPCRIGGAPAVELQFVIDDYVLHMQHHLDHILAREVVRTYPGAAIGF